MTTEIHLEGASNELFSPLTYLRRLGHHRHATRSRHQPAPVISPSRNHGCDPFRPGPSSRGRSDHATHTEILTVPPASYFSAQSSRVITLDSLSVHLSLPKIVQLSSAVAKR